MYLYKKASRFIKRKKLRFYTSRVSEKYFFEPLSLQILESFLDQILNNKKYNIINFEESNSGCNFIFRNDLDTLDCLKNFPKLAEILKSKNISSSFFVRVDDMDYDSHASFGHVEPLLDNFQCGLHSSCYIHDDYVKQLEIEIDKFTTIFGFSPKFLTLHGFGEYKYKQRQELIAYLAKNHKEFGIEFADCIPKHRVYDYVIQDCHLECNRRYIKKDIIFPPPIMNNTNYLMLTHPCYWR